MTSDPSSTGAHDTIVYSPNRRDVGRAMWRGARRLCPSCGKGPMFSGFLGVRDSCSTCGEELHHQRADDAPPYFTMFIVGHLVVGGALSLEMAYAPSEMLHYILWLPLAVGLSLVLLPIIKGALIGLQWAQRMHGFGDGPDPADPDILDKDTRSSPQV